MPTQAQVQNIILSAQLRKTTLLQENLIALNAGFNLPVNFYDIRVLALYTRAVLRQYNMGDYASANFLVVYDCLCKQLGGNINGATVDPNFQAPNTTIVIQNPAGYIPWMDIPWEAFSTDGEVDGGRNTYYNPALVGINPALQLATSLLLQVGIDYDLLPSGGFKLRSDGGLPFVYQGQFLRAESYALNGVVPDTGYIRVPQIFTDASTNPLSETYLNTTYSYPSYIEGDIIIVPAAFLQYQRQSNANPSVWSEVPYGQAGN